MKHLPVICIAVFTTSAALAAEKRPNILFAFADGAAYPKQHIGGAVLLVEGRNLAPALTGQRGLDNRPLFWEHQGNKAVRQGEWKAVTSGRGEWDELQKHRQAQTKKKSKK